MWCVCAQKRDRADSGLIGAIAPRVSSTRDWGVRWVSSSGVRHEQDPGDAPACRWTSARPHTRGGVLRRGDSVWNVAAAVLLAALVVGGLGILAPILQQFISYLVGLAVPIVVYRSLGGVGWRSYALALGGTVASGVLAGLFHSTTCHLLSNCSYLESHAWAVARCAKGPVNATYFGAICSPLLPAAIICLMMFFANRSRT